MKKFLMFVGCMLLASSCFAWSPGPTSTVAESVFFSKSEDGKLFHQLEKGNLIPGASEFMLIDLTTVTCDATMWLEMAVHGSTATWVLFQTNFVIGPSSGTVSAARNYNKNYDYRSVIPVYKDVPVGSTSSIWDYGIVIPGSYYLSPNPFFLKAGEAYLFRIKNECESGGITASWKMYWYEQ